MADQIEKTINPFDERTDIGVGETQLEVARPSIVKGKSGLMLRICVLLRVKVQKAHGVREHWISLIGGLILRTKEGKIVFNPPKAMGGDGRSRRNCFVSEDLHDDIVAAVIRNWPEWIEKIGGTQVAEVVQEDDFKFVG